MIQAVARNNRTLKDKNPVFKGTSKAKKKKARPLWKVLAF
jgi:hypothetical protein